MRIAIASSLVLAAALAAVGCGKDKGSEGPRDAHQAGRGTVAVYDASFDQTWQAAHAALKWGDIGATLDHPAEGKGEAYIASDPDAKGYNAQVGIWLDPMNTDKTRVSVVVVGADNEMSGPNEEGVQKDIAKAVALVKSGQPLPAKRP